ncbi:unnamed protein product [Boreogadus saida]
MHGGAWMLYSVFLDQRLVCFAVLLFFIPVGGDYCPPSCLCARESGTVTCRRGEHPGVPGAIPDWASTLILRGNNLTTLPRWAFCPSGARRPLVTLSLSHNGIRVIEPHAFQGLTSLLVLDLSHNRLLVNALSGAEHLRSLHRLDLAGNHLTSVPLGIHMSNLHTLVLTNNSIQTVGRDHVATLYQRPRMRIYLSLNPFWCGCELEAFCSWLRNSSQVPDVGALVCSGPGARQGVRLEHLQEEELGCADQDLEAVSYVFLGLVLALIGVVFLMVLYLNRGGIKRWLNNIREACRDQMEVYHYRYEQDSDPRLANVAV